MSFNSHREKGFTLLEVVVALAIVAVALGATIQTISTMTRNNALLSEGTLARWVAANQIAEVQLSGKWGSAGSSSGKETMADVDWYWFQEVTKTPDADLRKIEVSVGTVDDKDDVLTTLTGYYRRVEVKE